MNDTLCYLNGQFLPLSEAKISPLDRGFLYADGVYEVIPVYARYPFRRAEHLRRLQNSLEGIRLANPYSLETWCSLIQQLIDAAPFDDQALYLQITRGADVRRDMAFPKGLAPTIFMFVAPLIRPTAEQREKGISVITTQDQRWARCDLKTVSLLANVLSRQVAVDAGDTETLMIRDAYLTEGAASNIFLVKDGVILTPPKDHRTLSGITHDLVLELAVRHGAPHEIRQIAAAELHTADELWMTSSTKEVLPITRFDGQAVGQGEWRGRPGPVTRQMAAWYAAFRDETVRQARA